MAQDFAKQAAIVASVERERLAGTTFDVAVQRTSKRCKTSQKEVIKTLFAAGLLRPQVSQEGK